MQAVFKGDPIEWANGGGLSRTSIVIEGVLFPMGQPVDASALSEKTKAKLANNPHFEVLSAVAQPASAPVAVAPAEDDDAEEQAAAAAHAERAAKRKK